MKKILFLLALIPLFFVENVKAHCPLCTAGAIVAAGGAAYLGVKLIVIGIFIGAFGVSMGLWVGRLLKKKYIPYQTALMVAASFSLTVLPVIAALPNSEHEAYPLYVSIAGGYGSLLNRTYLFSKVFAGSVLGGVITLFTPLLSRAITQLRKGRIFPFQGVVITFLALLVIAAIAQVVM